MSFPVSKVFKVKPRKSRTSIHGNVSKIQLTSLIDLMTILLVFLLKSFSSEGDIVTVSEGLQIPESSAIKKPQPALLIGISRNELLVEHNALASLLDIDLSSEMIIPALENYLLQRKQLTEAIAQYSTTTEFKGEVIIEADRKIPFRILQKVMYTCGQAGYNDFSLLVVTKSEG